MHFKTVNLRTLLFLRFSNRSVGHRLIPPSFSTNPSFFGTASQSPQTITNEIWRSLPQIGGTQLWMLHQGSWVGFQKWHGWADFGLGKVNASRLGNCHARATTSRVIGSWVLVSQRMRCSAAGVLAATSSGTPGSGGCCRAPWSGGCALCRRSATPRRYG